MQYSKMFKPYFSTNYAETTTITEMSGEIMKLSIFCSPKSKLLLLIFIGFSWSFLVFSQLILSLIISTLWLQTHVNLYFNIAVAFFLIAISKGRGALNKVNELNPYAKAILNAFFITINVAHAAFCGWLVYMVIEQNLLLAAVTGSIQLMFNVALLFVKDVTHSSIE